MRVNCFKGNRRAVFLLYTVVAIYGTGVGVVSILLFVMRGDISSRPTVLSRLATYSIERRPNVSMVTSTESTFNLDRLNDDLSHIREMIEQVGRRYPETASFLQRHLNFTFNDSLPMIYAITPTLHKYTQKADLTRQSQTYMHVQKFHWIVVEDSRHRTHLVSHLLRRSGLSYTHLNVLSLNDTLVKNASVKYHKPHRGVLQRNLGLDWLLKNVYTNDSVVYFADDDNTYDLQVFNEMRYTKRVSVWPVGLSGRHLFERPLLNAKSKIIGWSSHDSRDHRPFACDMAGFAVSLRLFREKPDARMDNRSHYGHLESNILAKLVKMEDIEVKADNCTKVYVWHTRTERANVLSTPDGNLEV